MLVINGDTNMNVNSSNTSIILDFDVLLGLNKSEALEMYWDAKRKGQSVYFKNTEGLWLLNDKCEAVLIRHTH